MRALLVQYQRQLVTGAAILTVALILSFFAYHYARQSPEVIVKINVADHGISLPDGFFLYQHLSAEGITIKSITSGSDSLIISFNSSNESQAAQKVLKNILDNNYRIE